MRLPWFDSLELVFQSLELMFESLEHRFICGLTILVRKTEQIQGFE